MLASHVVSKDAYDYQSMNLSNLIKIMVVKAGVLKGMRLQFHIL
jgi:hypothetical protein